MKVLVACGLVLGGLVACWLGGFGDLGGLWSGGLMACGLVASWPMAYGLVAWLPGCQCPWAVVGEARGQECR